MASPNSTQLLQVLADYYRAANDVEKMKATFQKMAELRPDDPKLRLLVAQQLVQSGDNAGAVEHYRAALKKDPRLFMNQYWVIQNAFESAGKTDELFQMFESMDLKKLGQPYAVTNLIQNMLQNEKTRDKAFILFRKAWAAFPDQRANLMAYMSDDSAWKVPEMYDYAREAVIP